jgi:hypothetical protein
MARETVLRGVVALGHDLGSALRLPSSVQESPLVRTALERAGEAAASNAALKAIESSLVLRHGVRALRALQSLLA